MTRVSGKIVGRVGTTHVRVQVGANERVVARLPPAPALGDAVVVGAQAGELVVAEYVHGLEAVRLGGAKEESR